MASQNTTSFKFAVVAKDLENVFFTDVGRGCVDRAAQLTAENANTNVTCVFVGSPTGKKPDRNIFQIAIVEDLLANGDIDGMAIAVTDKEDGQRLIEKALAMGIPTITYNVDSPDSGRMAYVGADNVKFGIELANSLLQAKPEGGKYAIVDRDSTVIKEIAQGVRSRLEEEGSWMEATSVSPLNCEGKGDIAQDLIYDAIEEIPELQAIISAGSYPVREEFTEGWKKLVKDARFENTTFVVATERQEAVNLLKEGYIDSLVGLQTFMLGSESIDRLYELRLANLGLAPAPFANGTLFKAPLISFLEIDAYLQSPTIEMNYLGNLVWMGYIFFGLILLLSSAFTAITTYYRKQKVFAGSQPFFLYMMLAGAVIFSSTIIPLGFDGEKFNIQQNSAACMASHWLFSIGLITMMSALYAKTHRINKIMKSAAQFKRVKITTKDVLKPFMILMVMVATILICWTVISPSEYTINPASGTDHWNRTYKAFYGTCYAGDESLPYIVTLFLIIAGTIITLAVEAFQTRNVHTDFAESSYIAIVIFSLLQVWFMATPVLALLDPKSAMVRYTIQVISIFLISLSSLGFIFVPKIIALRKSLSEAGKVKKGHVKVSGLDSSIDDSGLLIRTYTLANKPRIPIKTAPIADATQEKPGSETFADTSQENPGSETIADEWQANPMSETSQGNN